MDDIITVAIPTLNAGRQFVQTLAAVAAQDAPTDIELLVCDSGSQDGTVDLARHHGGRVIEIPREQFNHGATRNLLMEYARGTHVAFLTQDAIPADDRWLATLLAGFVVAANVGLVFGPYIPQPSASLSVRRELDSWFTQLSPDGSPRIDELTEEQRSAPPAAFYGPLGYFTDANGCISRRAWSRTPFRQVAYAEDHLLAQDMLRAGEAKVFMPDAGVVHSHEYSPGQWLRRSFDETRGIAIVYGSAPGGAPRDAVRNLRGALTGDVRLARAEGGMRGAARALAPSLCHHGARTIGAVLGAHSTRIPTGVAARLSLEGRGRPDTARDGSEITEAQR